MSDPPPLPTEKKRQPWRPSIWSKSLGPVKSAGFYLPLPVIEFLKQKPVKRLINWMVVDQAFQKKILDLIPEEDPPESPSPLEAGE